LLTVAGVDVRTFSPYPLLDEADDLAYFSFLAPDLAPHASEAAIEVEVVFSSSPVNDSALIFDSDIAWHMQRESEGYRVSFRRLGLETIHTVMLADRPTTKVQIYVHQDEAPERPPAEGLDNPVRAPLDQVLFMNHLAFRRGVICHAAAAVIQGKALLFPGFSGAGKSTLCRMFVAAGLRDRLLSDDRVILRLGGPDGKDGDAVTAWGTPWHGDALIARNEAAPLAALLFLVQADTDEVVPIQAGAAMRRLMPLVSSPWYDPERLPAVLETCGRVVETVPCYELHFTRDGDVVGMLTGMDWT
jgi:hypothetical protein